MARKRIEVEMLTKYRCDVPTNLVFKNREMLMVEPGLYYVASPGVVIDLEDMTCHVSPSRRRKERG